MSEPTDETPLKPLDPSSTGEDSTHSDGKAVEDAPPKYAKALGLARLQSEMKEAKDKSPNNAVYFWKAGGALFDSGATLACLLPLAALAIAMIVIGALYKDRCPGQWHIPIWLIVFGSVALFQLVINCLRTIISCCCCRRDEDKEQSGSGSNKNGGNYASRGGGCCECIVNLFQFAWLIAGSVWVFGFRQTFYSPACSDPTAPGCCEPLPYFFAFGSIVAIYVLTALVLIISCCALCCCVCCAAGIGAAAASKSGSS